MNGIREPTAEEAAALEARRRRSDAVSAAMGRYLLRGYTMLADTCPHCHTILLRDREGTDYCVGCREVDSVATEEEPSRMAQPQLPVRSPAPDPNSSGGSTLMSESRLDETPAVAAALAAASSNGGTSTATRPTASVKGSQVLLHAASKLEEKILWAAEMVAAERDPDQLLRYTRIIQACAEARKALAQ